VTPLSDPSNLSAAKGLPLEEAHMKSTTLRVCSIAAAIGAVFFATHGAARAAGFQLFVQNASGLGTAYAGQAANPEDASTIFFNTAGLTQIKDSQFVGALQLVKPETTFSDSGSCSPYVGTGVGTSACPFGKGGNLGNAFGGSGGDSGSLGAVPGLYLSYEALTDRLWVGLGVNAPFGSTTEWDSDWMGRFHSVKSEIKTYNFNPTVAWKFNNLISVGGGLNAQRITADLSNAISYRAVALSSGIGAIIAGTPAGSEGVATVKGDDWGWGWNVGVLLTPLPTTKVGIAYRSAISYRIQGDVSFGNRPAALGAVPNVADGSIAADVKLPETLSLAVSHQATSDLQLLADWTWTGWNSIQDLTIVRTNGPLAGQVLSNTPLRFKDTWRAAFGVGYQVNSSWKVRAGTAYDNGATQDQFRTPRLPDASRIWLALGAQWKPGPMWAVDFGYAYLIIRDASSNLANQDTAASLPRGSLVGTYQANANILGVQARISF
jgi:long-chain fatty acid transport protein